MTTTLQKNRVYKKRPTEDDFNISKKEIAKRQTKEYLMEYIGGVGGDANEWDDYEPSDFNNSFLNHRDYLNGFGRNNKPATNRVYKDWLMSLEKEDLIRAIFFLRENVNLGRFFEAICFGEIYLNKADRNGFIQAGWRISESREFKKILEAYKD